MKRRYTILLLAVAAVFCLSQLLSANPVLLENDTNSAHVESSTLLLDAKVPLSALPKATEPEENATDLYEGLDETQIKYVKEVLDLINKAREKAGVPALELDASMQKAAQVRAKECVTTFSHTRPNGTSYKTAISEAGVASTRTGENVATGYTSAESVMKALLNSEGHRANILNANYTKIGIGLEINTGNRYGGYSWAQLFAE